MNRIHRIAAAVAGLSMAAAMILPAAFSSSTTATLAASTPPQPVTATTAAPAKPSMEGAAIAQKCHVHFDPLVEHELDTDNGKHSRWHDTDLVKLQVIVDVVCREAIGDASLFGEGRLLEKLSNVQDIEATLHGAVEINEDDLERGFCVDVEIDSANKETQLAQCFFLDDFQILRADSDDHGGKKG